jgi:hypothetical protein
VYTAGSFAPPHWSPPGATGWDQAAEWVIVGTCAACGERIRVHWAARTANVRRTVSALVDVALQAHKLHCNAATGTTR